MSRKIEDLSIAIGQLGVSLRQLGVLSVKEEEKQKKARPLPNRKDDDGGPNVTHSHTYEPTIMDQIDDGVGEQLRGLATASDAFNDYLNSYLSDTHETISRKTAGQIVAKMEGLGETYLAMRKTVLKSACGLDASAHKELADAFKPGGNIRDYMVTAIQQTVALAKYHHIETPMVDWGKSKPRGRG